MTESVVSHPLTGLTSLRPLILTLTLTRAVSGNISNISKHKHLHTYLEGLELLLRRCLEVFIV